MPYRERLHSWAVVRLQPKFQRSTVGRFRSRSDAEGHYWVLRRLMPETRFAIVFDLEADTAIISAVEDQASVGVRSPFS
jgi:hypothetical protein